MKTDYARTLAAIADAKGEKEAARAVAQLVTHLKSRGRMKLLTRILAELKTIAARRDALAPRVEVARAGDGPEATRRAQSFSINAARAVVNDSLITGWRARSAGLLVDRSGKRALIEIYQRAVNRAD